MKILCVVSKLGRGQTHCTERSRGKKAPERSRKKVWKCCKNHERLQR